MFQEKFHNFLYDKLIVGRVFSIKKIKKIECSKGGNKFVPSFRNDVMYSIHWFLDHIYIHKQGIFIIELQEIGFFFVFLGPFFFLAGHGELKQFLVDRIHQYSLLERFSYPMSKCSHLTKKLIQPIFFIWTY